MLINHLYEHELWIKVLLKENKILKIIDVHVPVWFNWFKHLITFFILPLLHTVSEIGIYGLLYILVYSIWMFRSSQLNNRINKIHEKDLKLLYEDKRLTFNDLFELDNSVTVHQQNLQILAAEIFKLKKQFSTWNNERGIWNKTNSLQFGFWI